METEDDRLRAAAIHAGNPASTLEREWRFVPSPAQRWMLKARVKATVKRSVPFPRHELLKSGRGDGAWALYFVYAPNGVLEAHHLFTLDRLRSQGFLLLVVVAGMTKPRAIEVVGPRVDGLIWKALQGFDFSAYTLGLWWLARHAGGSDVLVLNDSVFGPFVDVRAVLRQAPWRLTGFTGSAIFENHIQSYAFMIHDITVGLVARLSSIFNTLRAFDNFEDVVLCQELRLGRVAASFTSAGALWYAPRWPRDDPALDWPFELLSEGFPFIKRSLVAKNSGRQSPGVIRAELRARGFELD